MVKLLIQKKIYFNQIIFFLYLEFIIRITALINAIVIGEIIVIKTN